MKKVYFIIPSNNYYLLVYLLDIYFFNYCTTIFKSNKINSIELKLRINEKIFYKREKNNELLIYKNQNKIFKKKMNNINIPLNIGIVSKISLINLEDLNEQ